MDQETTASEEILFDMAQQLLSAMSKEESVVNKELLTTAENLIESHHFYVQLLFINLIISRMRHLPRYFEVMDEAVEDLSLEDMAEMTKSEKITAVRSMQSAISTQLDIVNAMLASKEASTALLSSLKHSFKPHVEDEVEESATMLNKLKDMTPAQRQKILKGTIQAFRNLAKEEQDS